MLTTLLPFEVYSGGFSKYEDLSNEIFKSFSKGGFFLALPTFSNSVLFMMLRRREGHLRLLTGSPYLCGQRIFTLMGSQQILASVR